MTAQEIVARYYDAWQTKSGDLSDVPLADDFRFARPSRATACAGKFVDGNTVCSIIDWEMAIPGVGQMTSAELLEVENGAIVRGELIYDAEELRRAMAQSDA